LDSEQIPEFKNTIERLKERAFIALETQGFTREFIEPQVYLNLRYDGTDTAFMIKQPSRDDWNFKDIFASQYLQEFGFLLQSQIKVDDIRIRAIGRSESSESQSRVQEECRSLKRRTDAVASSIHSVFFSPSGRRKTPVYLLPDLIVGHVIEGPALIIDATATILVEPDCSALVTSQHVVITIGNSTPIKVGTRLDPIQLSIFANRFMCKCFTLTNLAIAEQMGHVLKKTAISTNIKERLDFSCALFGEDGGLVGKNLF
jgi:5-oxoprolinase (ATP-hydrolysing)